MTDTPFSAHGGERAHPPKLRMLASDSSIVLRHGEERFGDQFGARDAWVFESGGRYFMHYDAAGSTGWLAALATSDDGLTWSKRGPILELGGPGRPDSASASYGTTYFDHGRWHMFYLGTPNATPDELRTPSFPYQTLKAEAVAPTGPWTKRPDIVPFPVTAGTFYSETASPGAIVQRGDGYVMIFSASTSSNGRIWRTLGLARTKNLDASWVVEEEPLLPLTEQIENSSLYFEESIGMWFLFTNHITEAEGLSPEPPQNSAEYTDAVWVYWARDLESFTSADKAVVVEADTSGWSPRVIGLPSVLPIGGRLAVYYDGSTGDSIGHGRRDVGVAWLDLPLAVPRVD
jgi:predicted GH43/DUF377 family glycosyl hydrolase